jgi:hypothetical protein
MEELHNMKSLIATILLTTTTLIGADLVLTWDDNSDNEDGFEIWRQQNGGEWLLIAATNADDSTFTDGVIPVGTTLSYRVRAWNQFGESNYTNIVSVNTFPPAAPSSLGGAVIKSEGVSMVPQMLNKDIGSPPRRTVSVRTYRDRHGGSNGDRFLDLSDYERVLGSICEENGWEYEAFRDYIFFDKECFNIENRQNLKSDLEGRRLSISKLNEYALNYDT